MSFSTFTDIVTERESGPPKQHLGVSSMLHDLLLLLAVPSLRFTHQPPNSFAASSLKTYSALSYGWDSCFVMSTAE